MSRPPYSNQQLSNTSRNPRRQNKILGRIMRAINTLPIPTLGPTGTIIGVSGLFVGTLALAVVVAVLCRAIVISDVMNPFHTSNLPTAIPNATPNPEFLAPTLDVGNAYQWQGTERVTVLLMGADTRPAERGESRPRSDSIMLLMADPVKQQASILSIPRDLYVDIPGYGLNRVNTAYTLGGGQLSMDTVQYNFGVRVNYYVMIEFDVFVTVVDEIGGIDVDVPKAIYDSSYPDQNYGYDPFYIEAGWQHMDGETALKYARTRHGDNDFERARRQQAVLFAIRDKVLTLNMLPTLIEKSPTLYNNLKSSIDTNLSLDQMISLALLAKDIPRESIRTGVIDANYVIGYETPKGEMVEIPDRYSIGPYLEYVFWLQ